MKGPLSTLFTRAAVRAQTPALTVVLALVAAPALAAPPGWPADANAVVAADGSGQFQSLQAAIAAAPAGRRDERWVIHVKPGVYRERIFVQREKRFLTLVGEDPETTVIRFDLDVNAKGADGKPAGTFATATAVIDADDFTAEKLGFENDAGPVGQALAIRVDGDRAVFRNCRFVGWQDTVLLNRGRQYFERCTISGHVDFIFGAATAFFEGCTILVRQDGYITAASTPEDQPFGFVFSRCTIRGETPDVRTYLGRPWRAFAKVTFLHTEMADVVRPEGWHDWGQPERTRTVRYAEYDTSGPGARPEARVSWARALTAVEAAALTASKVLGGSDGWDPQAEAVVAQRPDALPSTPERARCAAPARFRPDVVYSRVGRERLRLDVCVPPGKGPFPAALLVHGGGWIGGDGTQAANALVHPLTDAGIAWIAVGYRLAPQHRYPAPVEDVEAAIRWTKANGARFGIDPRRLALVGESAGGHLVTVAAVRAQEDTRVAAVVPFFAPVDLESDSERRGGLSASMRALFGRTEWDDAARAILRDASPLRQVRPGLPPFLLVHGTADMSVPYEQSQRLQARLRSAGVPCDLITVPDGTHGTHGWDALLPSYREQVVAWLGARLRPPSIVLVGDSTVTDAQGWGRGFAAQLASDVRLLNLARGGRSSKSYRAEGHWAEALRAVPDYVLLQFGHNDMPGKGPERETDPATSFRANLARYVDEARAAGAVPVLVTSLTRRIFGEDGRIHSNLEDYAEATRAVAKEQGVALVDLHARSIERLNALGAQAASALDSVKPDGAVDQTHLDEDGSVLFGSIVAQELRRVVPALAPVIAERPVAAGARAAADLRATAPWVPDRGDGTYQNPVLFQDISDPDAIRVGEDFYLVSSTFSHAPGLTLLHSKDLVNWSHLTSVLKHLEPAEAFSRPSRGNGVWAPAIRHHDGRYWIYYPDPDRGLFVTTAIHPKGPWTTPVVVEAGKGLIDPCPFWDDHGRGWLVHAWARSRAGIANVLTLHRLSDDGLRVVDDGVKIIDGDAIPGYRTLEGPKLYERNGYYYVFAPAGGVKEGWQSVFRSKTITGPYEDRIVLDQGRTGVNGPHQGAWLTTASGEDWFLHFQDREAFGRVVHLQPLRWVHDWPVIGRDDDADGRGEPVLVHDKPSVRLDPPVSVLPASDEFATATLGPQWQWQANPGDGSYSLAASPGRLRLVTQRAEADDRLWSMPSVLSQRLPGPAFSATTKLQLAPGDDGERAGLVVLGMDYAWIGLRRVAGALELQQVRCRKADENTKEEVVATAPASGAIVFLRVDVDERARCRFAYSLDGRTFTPLGPEFQAVPGRWVGARLGLFSLATPDARATGHADFDWIRVTRPGVN